MTRPEIEALIEGLQSANHPQPIDPKAVYRTRAVSLFDQSAAALRSLLEEVERLRAQIKANALPDYEVDAEGFLNGGPLMKETNHD